MSDAGASGEPGPPGTQPPIPVTSMVAGSVVGSNLRGQESHNRQSNIGMGGNNDPGPSGSGLAMKRDAFYVSDHGVISDTDSDSEGWTSVTARKNSNKRKSIGSPDVGNISLPNKKRNIGGSPIFRGNENMKHRQSADTLVGTLGNQNRELGINNPAPNCETEKGRILILTPQGSEQVKCRFVDKSILLYRILSASEFGKVGYEKAKLNFKKKCVVLVMNSSSEISRLLKIKEIGPYSITCSQPISHTSSVGVIHPVGLENTLEEIQEAINQKSGQENFIAERIYKKIDKAKSVPTRIIKITFPTSKPPQFIFFDQQRFWTKPYYQSVVQCYRCQSFGHVAKYCTSKSQRCTICAGPHGYKDCPKERKICANCGGPHSAGYGGCEKKKMAQQVQKVRSSRNISYREALLEVKNPRIDSGPGKQIVRISNAENILPAMHIDLDKRGGPQGAKRNNEPFKKPKTILHSDMGTQTEEIAHCATQTETQDSVESNQESAVPMHTFVPDLTFVSFLRDLMTSLTQVVEGQKPNKLKTLHSKMNNLIVKHYKINIDNLGGTTGAEAIDSKNTPGMEKKSNKNGGKR